MRLAPEDSNQSPAPAGHRRRPLFGLPRPVWLLGLTSLLTDTASEAIYPLLPVYLTRVLGAGAVSLGLIEGFAEAANSVLKILSGHLSDRWQHPPPDRHRRLRAVVRGPPAHRAGHVVAPVVRGALRGPGGQGRFGGLRATRFWPPARRRQREAGFSASTGRWTTRAPCSARCWRRCSCSCCPAGTARCSRSPPSRARSPWRRCSC